MSRVVYVSNGSTVGDGMRITRVSDGGSRFEVWTGKAFSEVKLDGSGAVDTGTALLAEDGTPLQPEG